jgi:hypothetical protein
MEFREVSLFFVCVTSIVFNTGVVYGSLGLCTLLGSFRSVKITCVDYFFILGRSVIVYLI